MLRSEEKKVRELGIFRCFMALHGADWGDQLHQPDPPKPDITVSLNDGILGVEITGVHDSSDNLPAEEGEQRELLAKAQQLYESAGHPAATVAVNWNDKQ